MFAWLISRIFSANEQYFSLTTNQPTVLSVMTYQSSEQESIVGTQHPGESPIGIPWPWHLLNQMNQPINIFSSAKTASDYMIHFFFMFLYVG